jgi:hypothetical protein
VHTTNGAWDLVAEIQASSLAEFDIALREVRLIDGIANSETSILLSIILTTTAPQTKPTGRLKASLLRIAAYAFNRAEAYPKGDFSHCHRGASRGGK